MAVGLTLTGNALGPGTPTPLFDHEIFGVRHSSYVPYAVTKDGQRFLSALRRRAHADAGRRRTQLDGRDQAMSRTPATRLGQYEILSAIGAGGMGEI